MRVWGYLGDTWACGHYRLAWPADAVADTGVPVTLVEPADRDITLHVHAGTGELRGEEFPAQAGDVVVFQRITSSAVAQAFAFLRRRGVAVVLDVDDDMAEIDRRNGAWTGLHGAGARQATGPVRHSMEAFRLAVRTATLVTVSTPALAQRLAGLAPNVRVLRNRVPAGYLDAVHVDSNLIGWGGGLASHPGDLDVMGRAIARLTNRGYLFETVGNPEGIGRVLGLRSDPGGPGEVPLIDWAPAIARFGIGLAPLADTAFNRAKSWLKPLEYGAVGVPWVASPLPEYRRLAEQGGGVLARHPREWEGVIQSLARDPGRRRELSDRGREVARANTIEGHAGDWVDAWSSASEAERKVPAGAG